MSNLLNHVYENSNLTFIKQLKVQSILNSYSFNVMNIEKVRSVYKIYSDKGLFCLKSIDKDEKKAMKGIKVMECLKSKGFDNTATPYCNSIGSYIVTFDKSSYYLTNWIDAKEINIKDSNQILKSSKLLAQFHKYANNLNLKEIKIKNCFGKWPSILNNKINFLYDIKEKLSLNVNIDSFDEVYIKDIDYYIKEAQLALDILKNSDYENLCKTYKKINQICHNSFYYQNILSDKYNNYYLIDLESCVYDIPARDISKFIMRVLDKKENLWNFELCKNILANYNSINTIGEKEYRIILSLIIFPYKYYKIGRKKYIKNKKWKEERFYRKLRKVNEANEAKKYFINEYIHYYNINL